MPIISMKITDLINWKGRDRIRRKEAIVLKEIIDKVHATNRKIRFWNVKDDPQAWNVLRALGADIIGVDNLEMMEAYRSELER